MAAGFLGICLYGIVLAVVTVIALFTKGWTKQVIIALILAWIPFVLFTGAIILLFMSVMSGGNLVRPLLIVLIVCVPLLLIGLVSIGIWKFLQRFRE